MQLLRQTSQNMTPMVASKIALARLSDQSLKSSWTLTQCRVRLTAPFSRYPKTLRNGKDGSGWRLDEIQYLEQTIMQYNPLRGSCSLYELPSVLKRKACLLSVTGPPADNSFECFRWSILAGLHIPSNVTSEIHWMELRQYSNELKFESVTSRMFCTKIGQSIIGFKAIT